MSDQVMSTSGISVVVSALLAAVVVSLLWLVIPPSDVWTISYIFALVAIVGMATSIFLAARHVPQGYSFPTIAGYYAIASAVFSVIAISCDLIEVHFPPVLYAIIHIVIFACFAIFLNMLFTGSRYIEKVGERAEQKHEELNQDKKDYWK